MKGFPTRQEIPVAAHSEAATNLAHGLSVLILFCVAAALTLAWIEPSPSRRSLAFALITPPLIIGLYLTQRGRLKLAARISVFGGWACITLGLVLNQGLQEPLVMAYPLVILAAGLLLDMTSVWLLMGLTLLAALGLHAAHTSHLLPPSPPLPENWLLARVLLASLAAAALSSRMLVNLRRRMITLWHKGDGLAQRLGEVEAREALLKLVVENVPALIHYADRDMLCLFANMPFRRFFGIPEDTRMGESLADMVGESITASLQPLALRALAGEGTEARLTLTGEDGTQRIFDCRFVPERDRAGDVRGYFGQMVDVTAKEKAEAELRRSEERFSHIFHSSPIPIALLTGEDGRLVDVNQSLLDASGWNREEIIGRTPLEIGFWPSASDREAWKDAVVAKGRHQHQELRFFDRDGRPRWAMASSELLTIGEERFVLSFLVDVTARKRAEEALARANRDLEDRVRQRTAELLAANRELESFAYSVSHDLRAPLRSIDGFSHILLSDYGEHMDEAGRSHLNRIRRSAQRLGTLIDDLLELSRVVRREMHLAPLDLAGLAREILADLAQADPGRTVDTVVCSRCVADSCQAQGDATLARILLENLLGNAWKYTSQKPAARIEFDCETKDGKPEFIVRDNGVGFDMAHAKRLFLPFERLHTASEFEGTGVGLATAARIVRRHGGEIRAQAAPDKGAEFRFTLG